MVQVTWPFQGRQEHGEWGHGTAPHAFEDDVQYRGKYHDIVRDRLASDLRFVGSTVQTEVTLQGYAPDPRTNRPSPARVDLLVRDSSGWIYAIEIKTGDDPTYTSAQQVTYPHVMVGHSFSTDMKVRVFGLPLGAPLPPIMIMQYYVQGPTFAPRPRFLTLQDIIDP